MADNRITTWAGQVQEHFMADIKGDPLPACPLEALAKTDLVPESEGSNTFRFFTRPFVRATRESLETFRARGSGTNPLTSNATNGGQLVSSAIPNKYETLTVDTVSSGGYDIDTTAGVDSKFNSPEEITKRARQVMAEALKQEKQEIILGQALYSSEWVLASASTVSLTAAVSASDTSFDISDAEKASSGIAVGDIVKIGAAITPNADDGLVETIDVALVKTVGADGSGAGTDNSQIDIETVTANFPKGRNSLAPVIFDQLAVSLAAHDSGVRVQIDRPQTLSVQTADRLIQDIKVQAQNSFIDMAMLVSYVTPEVLEVMYGTNSSGVKSPVVANDILGEKVLKEGVEQAKYRGIQFVSDANAMSRLDAISTTDLSSPRHYIWCFERNESVAYASVLNSVALDKLEGRAGLLYKLTWAVIHDAMMPRAGKIRSFLLPVTIS